MNSIWHFGEFQRLQQHQREGSEREWEHKNKCWDHNNNSLNWFSLRVSLSERGRKEESFLLSHVSYELYMSASCFFHLPRFCLRCLIGGEREREVICVRTWNAFRVENSSLLLLHLRCDTKTSHSALPRSLSCLPYIPLMFISILVLAWALLTLAHTRKLYFSHHHHAIYCIIYLKPYFRILLIPHERERELMFIHFALSLSQVYLSVVMLFSMSYGLLLLLHFLLSFAAFNAAFIDSHAVFLSHFFSLSLLSA